MPDQLSHSSPAEFLFQWLTENDFREVGFIGDQPALAPIDLIPINNVHIHDCNGQNPLKGSVGNHSLQAVVVSGVLEHRTKPEAIQMLAGYRNALVGAILVFVDLAESNQWSHADFYGLGFKNIAHFPHPKHPLHAFEYNLQTYNHKRLWNTPQYWANPENFGKYWW